MYLHLLARYRDEHPEIDESEEAHLLPSREIMDPFRNISETLLFLRDDGHRLVDHRSGFREG